LLQNKAKSKINNALSIAFDHVLAWICINTCNNGNIDPGLRQ